MRSGSLSARKAREVASRPAWELAISSRGRASISKGDLFWTGSRAGMSCYRPYIYNNGKQKSASALTFFQISKNYAWIRVRVFWEKTWEARAGRANKDFDEVCAEVFKGKAPFTGFGIARRFVFRGAPNRAGNWMGLDRSRRIGGSTCGLAGGRP